MGEIQGWPWARARWATFLGLISKLGLILKFFKVLLKGLNIFIYAKIKKAHIFKKSLYLMRTIFWYLFDVKKLTLLNYDNLKK